MGLKFTYNNLDWLIPWYLDDFLTLSKEQNDLFEQDFESLWLWHRQEELPKYVSALEALKTDIAEDRLSMTKIRSYREQTTDLYSTVAKRAITQSLSLMSTLTNEQIADITNVISDEAKEFEEYMAETTAEQRIRKTIRSAEKQFKKWLGNLTKKQKRLINDWGHGVESTAEFRYDYFKRSRKAFLDALTFRKNANELEKRLYFLVEQRDSLHSKAHLEARERNSQRVSNLLLELHASLTEKQKRRLLSRLSNYQESFAELAEESNTQ